MTAFLEIRNARLRIRISPFGAALAGVWLDDQMQSLVLGLPEPEDYAAAPHAIGVIVGPIAGRISNARLAIGGRDYRMEANTPPDCLHSGSEAIQNRLWDVVEHAEDRLVLKCVLPDGACGLPGRREFLVHYELADASLTLRIRSTTDADTMINATSHAYWTLDDAGDLSTHRLSVESTRMLETGADLIPTGRILDQSDGPFDFSLPRDPLAGPPLDGSFCIADRVQDGPRPILRLDSLRSGITLAVESNQPGVVLYTGENLPSLTAPSGTPPIRPFSALAIEPQGWPDAPNQSEFPSIFLRKGSTIQSISRFSFEIS